MRKNQRKIHVVGINSFVFEDLPTNIRKLIQKTNKIAIPRNYYDHVKIWFKNTSDSKKVLYQSDSNDELIKWLKENNSDVILISRGDPLWFGIGRILLESFSKEELNFYPSNTCMQLAFSKIKQPWQGSKFLSIHGRDSKELATSLKLGIKKMSIITDSKNKGLEIIRRNLIELQLENYYEFWICEELGFQNEKIRQINIKDNIPDEISEINIVLLIRKEVDLPQKIPTLFGIEDSFFKTFEDRPNLITKRDVRVQILADLELPERGVLWDIGAGSGSIGLEALKLRPKLKLFAIDKRVGTKNLILENAKRLNVKPEKIIEMDINKIPIKLLTKSFSRHNRILIGGCNKETKIYIIKKISKHLNIGDKFILPLITYELLNEIEKQLINLDFEYNIKLIQTYKGITISEGTRFEPNNPVFIINGKKFK